MDRAGHSMKKSRLSGTVRTEQPRIYLCQGLGWVGDGKFGRESMDRLPQMSVHCFSDLSVGSQAQAQRQCVLTIQTD